MTLETKTALLSLVATATDLPQDIKLSIFAEIGSPDQKHSINEVCEMTGYSRRTIQRYIADGTLKARKTARGTVRVPRSEVERVFGLEK